MFALYIIKWALGSISTIACMVIRSWLNNSSIIQSNDWGYISAATITQFYRISIKDFGHFMFREWQLIDLKNFWPVFFFTFFLNDRLINTISVGVFRSIYFYFCFSCLDGILDSRWNKPLSFKSFSYSVLDLSNTSLDVKCLNNLLLQYFRWMVRINNYRYQILVWFSEQLLRLNFQI